MWHSVVHFLTATPAIAIFLCLGLGYLLGKVHYKGFVVGSTVGVLVVGLLIGQWVHFQIPDVVKSIFFDLFIFTIGYEVGPSFMRSFKKDGCRLMLSGVFFSIVAFVASLVLFKCFHIGQGESAGIMAGALTQSAIIGTASSAINGMHISEAAKALMNSKVAIAYAITYVFGTVGVVIFIKNIAPKILHIDLKEETKNVVEALHYHGNVDAEDYISNPIATRAFKVKVESSIIGKSIDDFEQLCHRAIVIERLYDCHGKEISFDATTCLQEEMTLVLIGAGDEFSDTLGMGLEEIFDKKYLSIKVKKADICLTHVYHPQVLEQMADKGLMITKAMNSHSEVIQDMTQLKAGDKLVVFGPKKVIAHFMPMLGYEYDSGASTDVSYLTLGIVLGILLGTIVITVKDIPLTLGSGGGCLFAGLFFGWWQDKHPNYGYMSESVRWLLKSLGLNLFIACVGLSSGAAFIPALKQMGWSILVIGVLVSLIPMILTVYFSHYVLKLNPIDNIGSLCGSGTITAALNAVTEEAGSSIFALAYTPTYAIGNILLTIMGPLMMTLL